MQAILALPAAERSPNPKAAPADAMAAFIDPGDQAAGSKIPETKPDVALAADHALAEGMLLPVPVAPKTAPNEQPSCSVPPPNKHLLVCRDNLRSVAHKLAGQPVYGTEPRAWGVLTAISKKARLLPQGTDITLCADEHCFGRTVDDHRFKISDISVSSCHCKIYMDNVLKELNPNEPSPIFLKDTSTNGTYINWKKLRKSLPPVKLTHGDIISFPSIPHDDSYAFVYREVTEISSEANGTTIKRKLDSTSEVGSAPVSLDVRRLKKTIVDLEDQLASHVAMIEELRTEIKLAQMRHEKDLKEQLAAHVAMIEELRTEAKLVQALHEKDLKELLASHVAMIEELRTETKLAQARHEKESEELKDTIASSQLALGEKQKQFDWVSASNVELISKNNYLGERLDEAGKEITRLKVNICKLEEQLQNERNLRMESYKSSEDVKSSCFRLPQTKPGIERSF